MSPSLHALVGYAAWMLVLLLILAFLRTGLTLTGKRAANQFKPSGDDVSPFSGRLARAHANCYENLPVFAALVVAAHLSGHGSVTDGLALVVLVARLAQSSIHLLSTSVPAVMLRFTAFAVQVGIEVWWAIQLIQLARPG